MKAIKQHYKIKDSDFDVNLLSQYNLYLHIYLNQLHVCVVDAPSKKCLLYEQYDFSATAANITLLECLKGIWENHHLLSAALWHKVVVVPVNADFAFIPAKHYHEDTALQFLQLNCQLDWQKQVLAHTRHYEFDAVAVFPVNAEMVKWLADVYGGAKLQFAHTNSCFLHGLLAMKAGVANELHLLVHPDLLSIAYLREQRLKFVNTFPQASPSDVLYFALFVMQELGLAPEQTTLRLWGNGDEVLACQDVLQPYVKDVALGETNLPMSFGDGFAALPSYYAVDLFSAFLLLQ
jgi:hypothetical protein